MECISSASRAGEVKVPSQLYLPLWDVLSRSKVSVEAAVSLKIVLKTVIPFPLVMATPPFSPPVVHIAVGELVKPPTVLDTLQVRL